MCVTVLVTDSNPTKATYTCFTDMDVRIVVNFVMGGT